VFQKSEDTPSSSTGHPVRPNTPLNPSPRVSDLNEKMLRIEIVTRGSLKKLLHSNPLRKVLQLTVVSNNILLRSYSARAGKVWILIGGVFIVLCYGI